MLSLITFLNNVKFNFKVRNYLRLIYTFSSQESFSVRRYERKTEHLVFVSTIGFSDIALHYDNETNTIVLECDFIII